MGRTCGSQRAILILPFLLLFGSMTVLYGAGLPAKITSPADKAKVSGTVEVKAQFATSGPVAYVMLVVDDTRPISMNSAPWTFQLDTRELANGPHEISIEAYDSHALIATSKAITIYTNNVAAEPVVVATQQPPAPKAKAAVPAPKTRAAAPAAKARTTSRAPKAQPVAPAVAEVPTSTAALGDSVKPKAIEIAEAIPTGASMVPIVTTTMRGPAPEPTRTASLETPTARSTELAKAEIPATSATAPMTATPPMAELAQSSSLHPKPMVVMNGEALGGDVRSMLVNGRMHSGFRALFTATGARIDWLPGERIARSVLGSLTVEVPVGSRIAKVNGREVDMGGIATIKNGRTMVPLRFFAQVTGSSISWNAQTSVASVQTPTHALASVQASISSPASMQAPVTDSASMRTLIFEVSGRAP